MTNIETTYSASQVSTGNHFSSVLMTVSRVAFCCACSLVLIFFLGDSLIVRIVVRDNDARINNQ